MKEFKIRCHALSKIMAGSVGLTDAQTRTFNELYERKHNGGKPLTDNMEKELAGLIYKRDHPVLPDGAKTHVKSWLKDSLFKRDREWKILKIEKGLQCEPDGIKLVSHVYDLPGLEKNDEYFSNDYMEGTPDLIYNGVCRDIKCSWDLDTFPMFDTVIPTDDYEWQLQGYMILTGVNEAALDYTLINTPMPLVVQDLKKLYFQSGGTAEEWNPNAYESMYPNYRFDDIPDFLRVKTFILKKDSSLEPKIIERVKMCRAYKDEILNNSDKLQQFLKEI